MLILTSTDVRAALHGREAEVLHAVEQAYLAHEAGRSALPHSVFLRFPDDDRNRIIALPAYLGGPEPTAGVKWISSFPANIGQGVPRASSAIILNSMRTGQPEVLLEGARVSAWRTAASAALAARLLPAETDQAGVTLLGCGVINFAVLRFLSQVVSGLTDVTVHDVSTERATAFQARCAEVLPSLTVHVETDQGRALGRNTLVSVATNALTPYLDTRLLRPGTLVLHVSLRDVLPDAVLEAVNVVDDVDHVLRAATSVDVAARQVGHHDFIAATIGQLAARPQTPPRDPHRVTVVSPFGLGVLDLAVAGLVVRIARDTGLGARIENFVPAKEDLS
ncbi:2,3-diaminopropionate biosynthesis protein SbnB [Micromonospora sp. NPDC049051]|uniref:2,3-diaminopropionate biosynthesis protein SbnB n=1 Tax=unclassified Micromonospora TaxID=2617518 RepID=UPI0037203CA0